jgi:ketosteroid isomerase-like protein
MKMHRIRNGALAGALFFACALAPTASEPAAPAAFGNPQDLQAITAIENEMAAETDINKVMPHFADGATMADMMAPGWYEGKDQIRAAVEPQLKGVKTINYRMEEINLASDGQFACAAMRIHFDATKTDASAVHMTIRQLDAFKKIGGRWVIVQQHLSVPADAKTAMPIFDSRVPGRGALAWAIPSAPGPAVGVTEAKAEIDTWLDASEVPKTVGEMLGYYGPRNDVIVFDFNSPAELRGRKEMYAFYAPQFTAVRNMEIHIPVRHIDGDGKFGVEISQQNLQINMKNGTSQRVSFRQSDCVRRVGSKWYSFFEMGSFPVDAKTGKAIMVDPAGFW